MKDIVISLKLTVLTMLICCCLYPAFLWAVAQGCCSEAASGGLVRSADGKTIVGSAHIAQAFTQDQYCWPRPSSCGYAGAAACGSNLSPANPELAKRAQGIIEQFKLSQGAKLPSELVTASGSGLDPDITLAAALFQVERVAAARGLRPEQIRAEASRLAASPDGFGIVQPLVNVLALNMAVDQLH